MASIAENRRVRARTNWASNGSATATILTQEKQRKSRLAIHTSKKTRRSVTFPTKRRAAT
ncbi:hypothetical protein EJ110_NYTH19467 [Nymphaea thermarum]|nr:hypothetical protein EJ110_NYTH19467 [Nymphaea thermarum]